VMMIGRVILFVCRLGVGRGTQKNRFGKQQSTKNQEREADGEKMMRERERGEGSISTRKQRDPARVAAAAAASVDELQLPELLYSTSRFPSP